MIPSTQQYIIAILQCYPNAVPTFDAYNSFIVYDIERLTGEIWSFDSLKMLSRGFVDVAIAMAAGMCLICAICVIAVIAIIVYV